MTVRYQAPWHRQSFDRFLHERLPQLLAERMPLAGYRAQFTGPHTCRINLSVSARSGAVDVEYTDVPAPDEEGVFHLGDRRFVCPPSASSEALDTAEIRCVGEQFLDFLAERLGSGASDLSWDEALVRSWLPLRAWMLEFLRGSDSLRPWSTEAEPHGQPLDETNWLSRQTHLRRLIVPNRKKLFTQGQIGRTCPIETPEGTNIGRVLSIAQGAEIRDGELVVVDDRPEAAFGLSASMIPFIEHNDTNRTLMGANMMRQWLNPPDPEPALVQTGHEPPIDAFWCGRNLLTAFVSWGEDTFEDALTISESAAAKLGYPKPLEPGDKLSNRHGSKGIVSRILPDEQMPHLPDGTAVEIICSFMGCHTRLHFGQLLEALLGRIARIEGKPAVAPPFAAPPRDEIRRQLVECGLPESGMETLTLGRSGAKLARPSTVGWVYWGKTDHCVADKIHAHACGLRANRQGHTEYVNLRENRAYETIRETYHLRSTENPEAQNLCDRLAEGPVSMPEPPSPSFRDLQRRLRIAGIELLLSGQALTCRFREPAEPVLPLASPIPHPWIEDRQIRTVGRFDGLPEFADVLVANARLLQMIESQTPQRLVQDATDRLRAAVEGYFDALVPGEDREGKDWRLWPHPDFYRYAVLRLDAMVLFSGRSVIAPASDLHLDQLGLPDPIAWTLFGPLVIRELGDRRAVESRSAEAAAALDRVMARNWLILHRAPSIQPTSHIAFRPVRIPEKVIRIHSLVCRWLNADYDGDQSAVFLPITEAGQREAAEHLSVMGHLRQDPALLADLAPTQEMIWGLAELSRTETGRDELRRIAEADLLGPEGFVTRRSLIAALSARFNPERIEETVEVLEQLATRGLRAARESGASISPFFGATVKRSEEPSDDNPDAWRKRADELVERLEAWTDFDDPAIGPQVLAVKSGARGTVKHLAVLIGYHEVLTDFRGQSIVIRNGLADGLTPPELFVRAARAREAMGHGALDCAQLGLSIRQSAVPRGFNLFSRVLRSERPGVVFAHAAASGEIDPLTDLDSRMFVGLPA